MARERYVDQVQLLVDFLPVEAAEEEFGLKGGTAINLFYRNLPRLSVDVGLTFLPFRDRAQSLAYIDTTMMPIDGNTRRTKRSARSARTGLKRTFES